MVALRQHDIFGGYDELKVKPAKKTNKPRAQRERKTVARVLHLGAGVQSSTLVEMMIAGKIPLVDLVIFADTGDEPYWVYEQVWHLAERLNTINVPLIVTDDGSGKSLKQQIQDPALKFVSIPLYTVNRKTGKRGKMKRQCTANRKVDPCKSVVLDHLVQKGHALTVIDKNGRTTRRPRPDVLVEDLYGISLDELFRAGKRGGAWRKAIYPLIEQRATREYCEAWLKANGLRVPRKSSCKYCPFHEDEHWFDIQQNEPEMWEELCIFDDWLRSPEAKAKKKSMRQDVYLHRSCRQLREIDFSALMEAKRNHTKAMFESELCGDFCMT